MIDTTGIVLINGAGLNISIWEPFIKLIDKPVLAVKFPARDPERKMNNHINFEDYVNSTIQQIEKWDHDNFFIVAHSIGACVGLQILNHFNDQIKGFIAISSVIPESGKSFISALPFPQNWVMYLMLRLFGTKPPAIIIQNDLCNDLNSELTKKILQDFIPESRALYTTKIHYILPHIKRIYIKLTNDKSMPISFQDKMAKKLHAEEIFILESGHLPMLSTPHKLAEIITEIVDDNQGAR